MNCCPGISGINGCYGLRGNKKNRFSGITRADIEAQCAGSHLPAPPYTPTSAENAAYSECVSTKLQERGEGRIQTFKSIGDWVAQTFFGRGGRGQGEGGDGSQNGYAQTGDPWLMWLILIIIVAVLIGLGVLIFRKK